MDKTSNLRDFGAIFAAGVLLLLFSNASSAQPLTTRHALLVGCTEYQNSDCAAYSARRTT